MRSQLKNERGRLFFPTDWNHGPLELKARVLPMSNADPNTILITYFPTRQKTINRLLVIIF